MTNFYNKDTLGADELAQKNTDRGAYYRSEAKYIAQLTGHEIPSDQHDYFTALAYLNQASHLGLNDTEVEILGRMLTALALGTRFPAEQMMDPRKGENAAAHSLQAINVMEQLLHKSFSALNTAEQKEALAELVPLRQFTGLSLILHDMGEILGEAGYATAEGAQMEDGFSKIDMERTILQGTLKLAISSVERNETREDFMQKITAMREQCDIENKAQTSGLITRGSIENTLNALQFNTPELSAKGNEFHSQCMALWEMAEQPAQAANAVHDYAKLPANSEFVGQLVKAIEHVQGTRHMIRFARRSNGEQSLLEQLKEQLPAKVSAMLSHATSDSSINPIREQATLQALNALAPSNTQGDIHSATPEKLIKNAKYNEAELPHLFRLADANSPLQQKLIRNQRDYHYATMISLIDEAMGVQSIGDNEVEKSGTQSSEVAKAAQERLATLERIQTGYEKAIAEDRTPAEPSLGAALLSEQAGVAPATEFADAPSTTVLKAAAERMQQRRAIAAPSAA